MLQMLPSGRTFFVLQAFFSLFQCQMASLSEPSLSLTSLSAAREPRLAVMLVLNTDKIPLQEFTPEAAIDLWWDAKARKPSHGPRKQYKRTSRGEALETPTSDTDSNEEEEDKFCSMIGMSGCRMTHTDST